MNENLKTFKFTRHGQILLNGNASLDVLIYAEDLSLLPTAVDDL
jgi:hypothetical protein